MEEEKLEAIKEIKKEFFERNGDLCICSESFEDYFSMEYYPEEKVVICEIEETNDRDVMKATSLEEAWEKSQESLDYYLDCCDDFNFKYQENDIVY